MQNNGITPKKQIYQSERPETTRASSTHITGRKSERCFVWNEDIAGDITYFLQVVLRHGDCVSFTLTSDGGALSVTVLQGTRRFKAYAKDCDQLLVRLHDVREELYG